MSGYHYHSLIPSIASQLTLMVHAIIEDTPSRYNQSDDSAEIAIHNEVEVMGSRLLSQAIYRVLGLEEGSSALEIKHVYPWKTTDAALDLFNSNPTSSSSTAHRTPIACTVMSANPALLATLNFELGVIRTQQLLRVSKPESGHNSSKRFRVRIGPVGYIHTSGVAEGLTTRRLVSENRKRARIEPIGSEAGQSERDCVNDALCAVLIEGFLATVPVAENSSDEAQKYHLVSELIPRTLNATLPQLAVQLKELYGASTLALHPRSQREAFFQRANPFDAGTSADDAISTYLFCDFGAQTTLTTQITTPEGESKTKPVKSLGRLFIAFSPFHSRASDCASHLRNLLNTNKTLNGNPVRVNLISATQFLKSVKATGTLEGAHEN